MKTKKRRERLLRLSSKDTLYDYYDDINNSWLKKKKTQKNIYDSKLKSNFVTLQKKTNSELIHLFHDNMKACPLYQSLHNTTDETVVSYVKEKIEAIDALCSQASLESFLQWMDSQSIGHFFSWTVQIDDHTGHYAVYAYPTAMQPRVSRHYLSFLKHLFLVIRKDVNAHALWKLEREMAKLLDPKNNEPVWVSTSPTVWNGFSWSEYIGIEKEKCPSHFFVETPLFLQKAIRVFQKSENRNPGILRDYWIYKLLLSVSSFHSRLRTLTETFFKPSTVLPKPTIPRPLLPLFDIRNTWINRTYFTLFSNKKEIHYVHQIAPLFRSTLEKRILRIPWLSAPSRSFLLQKVKHMNIVIGAQDAWEPDPCNLPYQSDNAPHNVALYQQWVQQTNIVKLRHPDRITPRTTWVRNSAQNVYDVNAYYNNMRNEVLLPNALLQKPFVDLDKSTAYNFANIGTILGHEMMHSFDEDGINYDEKGFKTIKPFWREGEQKKYKQFERTIQDFYEEQAKKDGIDVNHNATLSENMADIGGFLLAEECFAIFLSTQKKGGGEKACWREFYRCYAEKWRSIVKPGLMQWIVSEDVHSLSKYRVNCVLAFSQRFQKDIGKTPVRIFPF